MMAVVDRAADTHPEIVHNEQVLVPEDNEHYDPQLDPSQRGTALGRWVGLGPYYAMFPSDFAFRVVRTYSHRGARVLDPFAGRATAVYAATVLGRQGVGIEINPLGWLYGK